MIARAGYTYRIYDGDKEVEHCHVVRVHGRRIYMGVTAYSCLHHMVTRLRWRKLMDACAEAGLKVTEEPTP